MTDEEMDKIIELIKTNLEAGTLAFARLSLADQQQLIARTREQSMQQIRQQFEQIEADGTMDKIRALHAKDLKRKRGKKKK
jgi:hypothetical protein